jgi:hypothetical protein
MSVYFEIACAAATNSLTHCTGTGFSKAVIGGNEPGWQELLEHEPEPAFCKRSAQFSGSKDDYRNWDRESESLAGIEGW